MQTVAIIGGGFFGMYLAEHFARRKHEVHLFEAGDSFMSRASYANQARVHNGYHYPRSVLTALRSRVSFPQFVDEFEGCIDQSFNHYYLIGRILSKITARQFIRFCSRIGAPIESAPKQIDAICNDRLIEAAFQAEEFAFDAQKIRDVMIDRIDSIDVRSHLKTRVTKVAEGPDGRLVVTAQSGDNDNTEQFTADQVYNCTYSAINKINAAANAPSIPLKFEMAEICLVEVPERFKQMGITVMCGPFFSVMPFPARGLHSFTHVRYTPHFDWKDDVDDADKSLRLRTPATPKRSAWNKIRSDARRYIPDLDACQYRDSLYEVKTVLPRSETDDSRPILFKLDHGMKGYHCIMGGKIDNVYDVISVVQQQGLDQ